jgi:hypothetical protein
MRRSIEQARARGTNLAFLGANTMYWRVRLAGSPGPRLMTGYRHDSALDPDTRDPTAQFREPPRADPESSVTGMLYECYPADADYRVVTPGWWGFRGTHARAGTAYPRLVGPEADRVYPVAPTPRPLQVLSNDSYSCGGVMTSAQSVYYAAPSGAGVFTAGTLRWGCAVWDVCDVSLGRRTSDFVRTVTRNVLTRFAQGPVGRRFPAHDNVREFDLPPVNTVPAS